MSSTLNFKSLRFTKFWQKRPLTEKTITVGHHLHAPRNRLHTTKYKIHTFFPKFLFERFKEASNCFFLFLTLLQTIPGLSPFGWHSTGCPLIAILLVSAATEIYQDMKRRLIDRKTNNSVVEAFHMEEGTWKQTKWANLQEGQIVKLERDMRVPADMVVLSSSEPAGMAYIETSNLDGEANLKIRQSLPATATMICKEQIEHFCKSGSTIQAEAPSRHIDEFNGFMHIPSNYRFAAPTAEALELTVRSSVNLRIGSSDRSVESTRSGSTRSDRNLPLTVSQLILRGARVKNTEWLYGVIVYAGPHSKLMLNSVKKATKVSQVHRLMNHMVLSQIGWLCLVTVIASILQKCANSDFQQNFMQSSIGTLPTIFLGDLILFSNLVPISLYVCIEGCLMFQAYYMAQDLELYDEERDMKLEIRDFGVIPNLGNVKYVMSDKTGTLTTNCMKFKFCSIVGHKYGKRSRSSEFNATALLKDLRENKQNCAEDIKNFLTACSVCHTVVPEERKDTGEVILHASSPDEATLVRFAKSAKFSFSSRSPKSITIEAMGELQKFRVLAVIEFSSARKRMGIVVRTPEGAIRFYIKGADTIILSRLKEITNKRLKAITEAHLREFANNGYRTLVFAYRNLSESEYADWAMKWNEASCQLMERQEHMDKVAEMIEKDLILIGASAIEDKLQERVPQTISRLLQADIRVWVLTGDKLETAVNIGHSCRLLAPKMPILILADGTESSTRSTINKYIESLGQRRLERRDQQLALIVDAKCLDFMIQSSDMRVDFLRLALCCSAVICCRCTPLQKASIVRLVKFCVNGSVLAIGDGANDVAMIQEADVGIGIAGLEGMQASHSADFSITQFRHLERLLLVHGAACYYKITKTVLFNLYKNILEFFILFLYTFVNGFSDSGIADEFTMVRYNLFYTSITVGVMGIHDMPAPLHMISKYPKLYTEFHNALTIKSHLLWAGNAIFHASVIFGAIAFFWKNGIVYENGRDTWNQMMGCFVYFVVTLVANSKAVLESRSIHWLTVFACVGSIVWFLAAVIVDSFAFPDLQFPVIAPDKAHSLGMINILPGYSVILFLLFIVPTCLIVDVIVKVVFRTFTPTLLQRLVQSLNRSGQFFVILSQPFVKICDVVGLRGHLEGGRYGFMFAQDDGRVVSQAALLKMYDYGDDNTNIELGPQNEFKNNELLFGALSEGNQFGYATQSNNESEFDSASHRSTLEVDRTQSDESREAANLRDKANSLLSTMIDRTQSSTLSM